MAKNIQAAVDVLQIAKDDAITNLAGLPNIQNTVRAQMNILIGGLQRVGNLLVASAPAPTKRERKPLTHIAGMPIGNVTQPKTARELAPTEEIVSGLQELADEAMIMFLQLPAEQLRELYEDLVIRAVANKAGMHEVTAAEPARITIRFIETVKAAVELKAELDRTVEEAAAAGTTGKDQELAPADDGSTDESEDAAIVAALAAKQAAAGTSDFGVNIHTGSAQAPAAPAKDDPAKEPSNNKPGKTQSKA